MTYRANLAGASIVEVPIEFTDRVLGESKMCRSIVVEAFRLVTWWAERDVLSFERRRRFYNAARTS